MPGILLRGGWGSIKPPVGTPLTRGNPLATGLVAYVPCNEGGGGLITDLVSGAPGVLGASHAWSAGPSGPVLTGTGSAAIQLTGRPTNNLPWTIDAHYMTTVDTSHYIYGWGSSDGTRQVVHISDSFSEATQVNLYGDDGSTVAWGGKILGVWRRITVTMDAALEIRVYLDGRYIGSRATPGGTVNADATLYVLGAKFGGFNGAMSSTAFWGRALAPSEIADLHADPYQMFAPPVWRRYFVVSAGGGTGVTVTPAQLTATVSLQAPTVSAVQNVTVTLAQLSATLTLSAPTVSVAQNVTVSPTQMTATLTLAAPTVSAVQNVTVSPTQLTATATLSTPTVSTAGNVTVTPGLLTATLTLHAPTISITQFARPTTDISAGGWTTDTGATTGLFDAINETAASDSDYIRSGISPAADVAEVSLGTLTDPGTDTGFKVRYRYGKDAAGGEQIDLTVALVQGTTIIASWPHTDVSDTLATVTQTLSEAEAAAITDFSDLRLRFTADVP